MYLLYKLKFPNGIHIGEAGSIGLEATALTVPSDTFYSAIYSEYMKLYNDDELLEMSESGKFKISDLLPFKNTGKYEISFYLPKPFVSIERKRKSEEQTVDRKKVKALTYIPASRLKDYCSFLENGTDFPEIDQEFGKKQLYTKNKISRIGEDTELYNIEVFKFNEESGLYFIVELPEEWQDKFENILNSLSLTGIGGKKTSGYGQFLLEEDPMIFDGEDFEKIESEDDAFINRALYRRENNKYLLLSSYSPSLEQNEVEKIKEKGNGYHLIKRSGFVNNSSYSENPQKRKQVYMISSGSVFNFIPEGRLLDLKLNGNHSLYRMGKPIILGVDLWEK